MPTKIYVTPTDEDARNRPTVEVRDRDDQEWSEKVLAAVYEATGSSYWVFAGIQGSITFYRQCRMDTGIEIPDGWRLADVVNEWFYKNAKAWDPIGKQWCADPVNGICWLPGVHYIVPVDPPSDEPEVAGEGYRFAMAGDESREDAEYWSDAFNKWKPRCPKNIGTPFGIATVYRVPIDPPPPKYREFRTREEWWPHRNRWVTDPNTGHVFLCSWRGENCAKRQFDSGYQFHDNDGNPCEPFGVRNDGRT